MKSEVAVIRRKTMASKPLCRMDPPPRSFAADAYDCIMAPILADRPEYKVVARFPRPMASSPRIMSNLIFRLRDGKENLQNRNPHSRSK